MAKLKDEQRIEDALKHVTDEPSFIQKLLIDALDWPIEASTASVEDIAYEWTKEELKAAELDRKVIDGRIRQIALAGCPWGIFIVEFKHPEILSSGRGMTVPLRHVLAGLVPKQRKASHLPSFLREHLLFICTYQYKYFRFVHFKDPGASFKQPKLASFGWWPGDTTKTVCKYNLPHLKFLEDNATVDDWTASWTAAFDVERVTKQFYEEYKRIHALFRDELSGVPDPAERTWLASVLLNRLMFVYFLQKKGFLDGGNESYLEQKLKSEQAAGKNRYYTQFLTLLFFEGFAKPPERRSDEARNKLGTIRYLNGGLFLEHPIEQKAREAGRSVSLPDSVFVELFTLFAAFSWNLNDTPGGQDNEINPDVLGYIVEKYINQKAFGAYYTRPEITGYLCERTIHRLILDAVNTPAEVLASTQKAGLPVRSFKSVADLLKKLDPALATKVLDDVLPNLSLLDPACGSGAFLVAAMKTLIDIYAAIFGWVEFSGSPPLKKRLQDIRAKHASLDYFIKKRIITDNLYGVDIMEEAVEIARLRLFLALASSANTVEELEPLPNIDFNILRGNSLIGLMQVDPNGFDQKNLFLPPYEQVLKERDRQLDAYRHIASYADDLAVLRDKIAGINTRAQDRLDDLLLADFASLGIKFEQATWDDKVNDEGKPKKRPLTTADIKQLHPFHWAFEFDKVMARGGFDAIITNPPWEIVKPNGKEFFEQHSELVSKKNMSIHAFQAEQEKLLKDPDVRESWLNYLSRYPHQSLYFRSSDDYSNQIGQVNGKKVGSDLNLYKLFVERCYRLLRDSGQCGIVIPSGIYTDLGAKQLRSMLFETGHVRYLRSFSNERFIFEGVHHAQKFCLLIFGRGGTTTSFEASFRINPREAISPAELADFLDDAASVLTIDWALVCRLSPDSLSIMEFKSQLDVEIAKKMLRFPLLGEDIPGTWRFRLSNDFHTTNDSDLYHTEARRGSLPVFEGKMMWQFDHTHGQPRFWVDEKAGRERLLGGTPDGPKVMDYQKYRLVYRRQSANTNERTLVATMSPRTFHVDNLATLVIAGTSGAEQIGLADQVYLVAILNSFVVDAAIRQKVTTNLNFFYLYQLPVPRLNANDSGFQLIVQAAAKLICTAPDFDDLAKSVALNPPDHRSGVTVPAERSRLRAKLDAVVAHLYRLTEQELAHILSAFPLVAPDVKEATISEFKRMAENGEAAIFNPEVTQPAVAVVVDPTQAVRDLIAAGESATVEFKSTARWDVKQNQPGKHIERVIVKTIAAFLNTSGGTLVIGVEDNGNVYGLAEDYKLSGNKGRDGFELWLMQTLLKEFGKDAAGQIAIAFHELNPPDPARPGSGDVCLVTASPSPKPRFVVENGQELFFIRTGNATNALKMSELVPYCNHRWPEGVAP